MLRLDRKLNSNASIVSGTSSKGNQSKWFQDDEFLKQDSDGYEGMAEWVCYNLLRLSNIDQNLVVKYSLCNIELRTGEIVSGCVSPNFLKPNERLITLHRLLESLGISSSNYDNGTPGEIVSRIIDDIGEYTGLDWELYKYFYQMLSFDAIVLNEDRHLNNIAFVVDDQWEYSLSPYFDHGLSLLSRVSEFPYKNELLFNIERCYPAIFDCGFDDILKEFNSSENTRIQFDKVGVELFLEDHKNILGRAGEVLKFQMRKYSDLFI